MRLDAVLPGAIEGRRHDEERHEQREADEHEIGGRALDAEARAQKRKRDDEAREARHHDEEARRDRKKVRIATISMMRPLAEAPPAGMSALRSHTLSDRPPVVAIRSENPAIGQAFHCTTSVRITSSRTFPPAPGCRAFLKVLTDVLQTDWSLELLQRDGPEIREEIVADLARDRFGMRQKSWGRRRSNLRTGSICPAASQDW